MAQLNICCTVVTSNDPITGVLLTATLKLVSTMNSCTSYLGYAFYRLRCDRGVFYSAYFTGVTKKNYLWRADDRNQRLSHLQHHLPRGLGRLPVSANGGCRNLVRGPAADDVSIRVLRLYRH